MCWPRAQGLPRRGDRSPLVMTGHAAREPEHRSITRDISRTPIEGGTLAAANTIRRIEHEQLPAAARAWSPIHTEPDFSVTALTPRTRVCGHRQHSAVQAESSKPKRQTCEGQIAKFRNLNSCVTRDTFVFFAAAAVAVWHGPGADGEKSNAACAGWVMRAACGARTPRCARGGSREGDPEQGF